MDPMTQTERGLARMHDAPDDHLPALASQGDSLMAVISRAAENPNTNVDNLERLLGMYERIKAQSAKAEYFAAMSQMQDELPSIKERGEIKIGNTPGQKYALWEDINAAIKPVLKRHGFALSFRTGMVETKISVTGVLSHSGGHSEETTMLLPSDTSGSKNAVQAVGSSTSYGKRYVASALLNLTTGEVDDDGKAAGAGDLIDDDQIQTIMDMLKRDDMDKDKFCTVLGVEAIPDIKRKNYESVIKKINEVSMQRAALKKAKA